MRTTTGTKAVMAALHCDIGEYDDHTGGGEGCFEHETGECIHAELTNAELLPDREQITAVRELHILYTDHRELQWCYHCETPWPCPTIQALEGEEMKFRNDMKVELVSHYGSDEMVARAARVSTDSDLLEQEKIRGLLGYLIRNSHTSPLEHVGATFRFEVPLFVRDQIVRHRTFSYNIRSFRFGEASPEFYLPPEGRPLYNAGSGAHPNLVESHPGGLPLRKVAQEEFRHSAKESWKSYTNMLEYGVAEEVARGVLPTNLYTSMYMTGNLWNWLQFLEKRIESEKNKPQFEVEVVAKKILGELERLFPVTMGAWEDSR